MENLKNIQPIEDFNWDALEKGDSYGEVSKDDLVKTYDETLNTVKDKEVVMGTVTAMNKREVVVNIGFKSDGVVSMAEFRYNPDLKIGDEVEVYIENQEDKKGQLILSHKKARATRSWDRVNEALEKDEIIKGYIKCRTKGGMIVDVFGIEAFLPGSQIDVKPIRDYDVFVGKTMEFKIVKINQEFKNVVVSHKALIEAELEQQKKDIISKLEKGQVLEGTVKNITSYGVFIDLGGVDGLIHITDLSWGRVSHPEEIVQLDQKINVVILDFDDEKKRIALGLKQLTPHPWDALDPNLKVGDKVKGKVVVMADYGAFIEIAPGVEGLIHVSEMSWTQHLRSAQDFMKVGDEIEAVILTLDRDERKMSLGIKQLKADPWEDIESRFPVGSRHMAKVRNFTNFGVFVEIEEGVDGLIHITDLSWGRVSHPEEIVQLDQKINVVILDFDDEKKRIALGLKQLTPHPWDALDPNLKVGDKVKGKVVVMADYGAFIEIAPGVEGLIHVSEMSWTQHLRSAQDFMKVGDEIEAVILTLDRDERKMSLGIKQLKADPWEDIESRFPVGSRHMAKVRNFTNFGVFVEIEEGVDGLIHISDLSWTKKIKHPSEFTQIGAEIEVQVLEIDKENRRLSLGHKQLEENPWDVFETIFTVGSIHEGTIIEVLDKGAVISLPYGVEGFATPKHLVKEDGSQAAVDEKLQFKVIEFNKEAKRIILSHSRIFEDEQKGAKKETGEKKSSSKRGGKKEEESAMVTGPVEKTTLGDIEELAALKEKLAGK